MIYQKDKKIFILHTHIYNYLYLVNIFRNFKLLSFGEEAEEDEEELIDAVKVFSGRPKSTHDVLKDPHLSSEPAVVESDLICDISVSTSDHTSK